MKQTVYTASPESQQIHVWRLNTEGTLTLVQVVDVPGQVQPMVISPDKRFSTLACVRSFACWPTASPRTTAR
jgi:6-phosphogluconolactonase (cycloisomerase 2 family)